MPQNGRLETLSSVQQQQQQQRCLFSDNSFLVWPQKNTTSLHVPKKQDLGFSHFIVLVHGYLTKIEKNVVYENRD